MDTLIKKIKLINIFRLIWLITILLFVASLMLINLTDSEGGFQPWRPISVDLFLANICLGIISFLLSWVKFPEIHQEHGAQIFKLANKYKFTIVIIYFLLYSSVFAIAGIDSYKQRRIEATGLNNSTAFQDNQSIDAATLSSPTITPTMSVKSVIKYQPTPTADPDPIITCTFQYIEPRQMRKSECSKSTDCQIGGKWYFYTSVESCKSDQSKYQQNTYGSNSNYNYSAPTANSYLLPTSTSSRTTPTPTLIPYPTQIMADREVCIARCLAPQEAAIRAMAPANKPLSSFYASLIAQAKASCGRICP